MELVVWAAVLVAARMLAVWTFGAVDERAGVADTRLLATVVGDGDEACLVPDLASKHLQGRYIEFRKRVHKFGVRVRSETNLHLQLEHFECAELR